jgi:hypothetical protein
MLTLHYHSFANNIGAIVGVAVGALIALAFIGLWIYLALRRTKEARTRELNDSTEQVIISSQGGWRPPLEDGDEDDGYAYGDDVFGGDPFRYAGVLAMLRDRDGGGGVVGAGGGGVGGGGGDGDRPGSEHGTESIYSGTSAPASSLHVPYMTGFGQAAETMRDENAAATTPLAPPPMSMVMMSSDLTAPAASMSYPHRHRRSLSSGALDPSAWIGGGRDVGYGGDRGTSPYEISSPSHSQGQAMGTAAGVGGGSGSGGASYQDATRSSSSHLIPSSTSELEIAGGSSRRSTETRRQSSQGGHHQTPTPPTSYSFRRRAGSGSDGNYRNSLRDIISRLRGGGASSPGPINIIPRIEIQVTSPPTSASPFITRFSDSTQSPPTSPPPQQDRDPLWPPLTLPSFTFPSPAVSDDSHEVPSDGLLDPRLPWRLEQARVDSTASLRDHEDYSRPIGRLVRSLTIHPPTPSTSHPRRSSIGSNIETV